MEQFYLQMHITNKCHGRCNHCYQENYGGDDMQITEARRVIEELSQICKKVEVKSHIAITGGDPIMGKGFFKILTFAREVCDRVAILGNPELLTEKNIADLAFIGIDNYQLSLDGLQQTHDENRYVGSFEKICKAIVSLSKAGIPINISMTLTDKNRKQVEEVREISKTHGAYYLGTSKCVPNGEDCAGKKGCSLGSAVMTILPDLTLMACRRTPSSVLGKWTQEQGLEYHFVHNSKMITYRNRRTT